MRGCGQARAFHSVDRRAEAQQFVCRGLCSDRAGSRVALPQAAEVKVAAPASSVRLLGARLG